jgi:hypothetical protein
MIPYIYKIKKAPFDDENNNNNNGIEAKLNTNSGNYNI